MSEMFEPIGKYDGLGCFLGGMIGIPLTFLLGIGMWKAIQWISGWSTFGMILGLFLSILFAVIGVICMVIYDTRADRRK